MRIAVGRVSAMRAPSARADDPLVLGHDVRRAQRRDHELVRRLELRRRRGPRRVVAEQRRREGREVAVALQEGPRQRADQPGRRVVGDEVPCHARRHVARGRWMARKHAERRDRLVLAVLGEAPAEQELLPRLVGPLAKQEAPGIVLVLARDGPAGEDAREGGDVVLRIAAAHPQRVQLEDLARQVLVEPARALQALTGARADEAAGADRLRLVQVQQHGRVRDRGQQQVLEAAHHMGPDRIGLEPRGQPDDQHLVHRHGEVVGPEVDEPLGKGGGRLQGAGHAGPDGGHVGLAAFAQVGFADPAALALGGQAHGALLGQPGIDERRSTSRSLPGRRQGLVALQLRVQPAPRLLRWRFVRPGAEPEAVRGDGGCAHAPIVPHRTRLQVGSNPVDCLIG